jgi:hypothetical protein
MPKNFDELSDALRQEVMGEMAETFFGERKHVEDVVERIKNLAAEVEPHAAAAVRAGGGVHFLLLSDADIIGAFYRLLGVAAEPFLAAIACCGEEPFPEVEGGFALTRGGRYVKLVLAAYAGYQQALDAYLFGRPYDDPIQPGRKRLSANLAQIKELTAAVNVRIAKLNQSQSPADILCFIRTMDPEEMERRRITGATLDGFEDCLNRDMAMPLVDWAAFKLPDLPELPPPEAVAKALGSFLEDLYARNTDRVAETLARIKTRT